VARAALGAGAWGLVVSTLAEAREVSGLCAPERILVVGGLVPGDAPMAAAGGFAVACSSREVAEALARSATAAGRDRALPVHLKVDTGMGRLGCTPADAPGLAALISRSPGLELAGTLTHFAASESDPGFTRQQFSQFEQVLGSIGPAPGLRHACNSAAARLYPGMAMDAVRVGISLYGCEWPGTRPALSLRASLTLVKDLPAGHSVGYGRGWRAKRPSRIATVAIGYADGVHRARSNRGAVLVSGVRVPVAGRVSMDSMGVDVTDVTVAAGEAATLIGADGAERITAEEVAKWSDTISYEVLTAIGPRVERRYAAAQE
jgi:alanine racemase